MAILLLLLKYVVFSCLANSYEKDNKLIGTYNQLYKNKNLVWRVAENFEAEPGYRAAAAAIRSGKIGKVIFFKTLVNNYIDKDSKYYKTPWRTIPDVSFFKFDYILCARLIVMIY